MLAIKGIYDGKTIHPLEKIREHRKFKVIITFIEEFDDGKEIRTFSSKSDSFSFWENEKEDIYQDYLPTTPK